MRRKYGAHWGIKFGFLLVGLILLLAGLVMIVTPGPGWLFIFAGIIVICCVSYPMARNMDKAEKHVMNKYHQFRNRKKNGKKP